MKLIAPNILVINLQHNAERLAYQRQQIVALGFKLQRINAVGTAELSDQRYERLANGWERKLRKTEVACFLSHRQAWKKVLKAGKAMLILEDDALLCRKLPKLLEAIDQLPEAEFDYISLETRKRKKLLGKAYKPLGNDYQLKTLYQDRTGAAAYILFPSGAKKLLNAKRAPGLADAFISSHYRLNAYQVVSAAAIQSDCANYYGLKNCEVFASNITPLNNERPKANSKAQYYVFKCRRVYSQLRMGLRQLSKLHCSEKRQVMINQDDFSHLE